MRELIASTWFLPAFSILASLVFLATHFSNNKWREIPELSRGSANLDSNTESAFDIGQAIEQDPGGLGDFFPSLGGGIVPGGGTLEGGGIGGAGDVDFEDLLAFLEGDEEEVAFTYTPTQTPMETITFLPVPTSEPKIIVVPPSYYDQPGSGGGGGEDSNTPQPWYWVTDYPGQPTPDPILIPVAPPFAKSNEVKDNAFSPVNLIWNIPANEPTKDPAYLWDPDTDPELKLAVDNNGSPVFVDWSVINPSLTPVPTDMPVPTDLPYTAVDNNGSPVTVQWKWDIPEGQPTPDPAGLDFAPPSQKVAVDNDGSPVFITWTFPQQEDGTPTPSMVPSMPPDNNPNDASPVSLIWNIPYGEPTPDPVYLDNPITPPVLVTKATPNDASPVNMKWSIPWGQPTPDPVWLGTPNFPPEMFRPTREIEVGSPTTNYPSLSLYPTEPGATRSPTKEPTKFPTKTPTNPGDTLSPTKEPTKFPTETPTNPGDTRSPTAPPTDSPTTLSPTAVGETRAPTKPLVIDTFSPTMQPTTSAPIVSLSPTALGETRAPTKKPRPVEGDWTPSLFPSMTASNTPSVKASNSPSVTASISPSVTASTVPTVTASNAPSITASSIPTVTASLTPSSSAPVQPNASSPIKAIVPIPGAPQEIPTVQEPVPDVRPRPPPVVPLQPVQPVIPQTVPQPLPVVPQPLPVIPQPVQPVIPQTVPQPLPPFQVQPQPPYPVQPPYQPQPPFPYYPQPPYQPQPPYPYYPQPPYPYYPPFQQYPPPPWVFQPQPPYPPRPPFPPQPPVTPGPPVPAVPWVPGPQIPWWQPPPGWWVTQPVAPVPIYTPPPAPTPVPFRHNQHFDPECNPLQCVLNEDAEFHAMSNEDEAIYELFYTNPIKCCLVVVEIGVGDGERNSFSKYFEDALKWKTLLIEANPDYFEELKVTRPGATAIENGGFCESSHMEFYPSSQTFHMLGESVEVSSELHAPRPANTFGMKEVPCLKMEDIFDKHSITKVDVMVIRVQGDALGFIRNMDWTKRVDVWIILFHDSSSEHISRDLLTQDVLLRNDYVAAEWDIKRWCETLGSCLNNHVFLRKGFNPLPCDYIIPGIARNGNHPKKLNTTVVR